MNQKLTADNKSTNATLFMPSRFSSICKTQRYMSAIRINVNIARGKKTPSKSLKCSEL